MGGGGSLEVGVLGLLRNVARLLHCAVGALLAALLHENLQTPCTADCAAASPRACTHAPLCVCA
eukprot:6933440-Alexandrium_andersonii.AAC.1